MAQRGRPMKRVPAKEIIDVSDHKLYGDGTYENVPPVTIEPQEKPKEDPPFKGKLKVYDVLVMDNGTQWQVLDTMEWGVGLAKHPRNTLPSFQDMKSFSWEDLTEQNARKV